MNCRDARRCLSPYLDSELDPTMTFSISEHLRVCEDCRRRFDAEREVDRCIVSALESGRVSDEVWNDITRTIRSPRRKSWRLYAPLATAAAVVMVAWSGWLWKSGSPQAHWLVSEFLAETDGGKPFESANAMAITAGMTMPLKPFTDLQMNFAGEDEVKHIIQLVRLDTVQDADGAEMVEMRLNCCGEPVIVRVAKRDCPGKLREFLGADEAQLAAMPTSGKVAVAEREIGEYVVVAVSRHPMNELLSAMQVQ